jgi:beta-lactamase class A
MVDSDPDLARLAATADLTDPSIVLVRLTPGPRIERTVAASAPVYPASMIKVPLALAVAVLAHRGELSLNDSRPVAPENLTANDLSSPLVSGYRTTVGELVELMITQSDNVATNELIDVVGRERASSIAGEFGLAATAIRRKLSGSLPLIDDPAATGRNTHPASDAARLFELIAQRDVPEAQLLEEILLRQRWNDKLSGGLLPGDNFAHKTGETSEGSHDGGILFTADGARWIVVVYSGVPAGPAADACHSRFMRALRPELDSGQRARS